MITDEDIKWINENRKEISSGRKICASFEIISKWDRDEDLTDYYTSEFSEPIKILISGIFKDKGVNIEILERDTSTDIDVGRFSLLVNKKESYLLSGYLLSGYSSNNILDFNEDNFDINNFSLINDDNFVLYNMSNIDFNINDDDNYIEQIDKVEIPYNSGKYYKIVNWKKTGMKEFNKISFEMVGIN